MMTWQASLIMHDASNQTKDVSAPLYVMDVSPVTLRCAGALSGSVTVQSLQATVGTLRHALTRLLQASDPSSLKVIAGGVVLSDDAKTLQDYGVTPASRLLITKGAQGAAGLHEAEARLARLERVRAAATRFASRSFDSHSFNVSLENQSGVAVAFDAACPLLLC